MGMSMSEFRIKLNARYGRPPDDGAKYSCADCHTLFSFNQLYLTAVPAGQSSILCEECVDADWLAAAEDCGQLQFDR